MAKVTGKYETIFVVNPNLNEEETKQVVERFTSLIGENGEIEKVDEWGKRRLAYPIQKLTEGYYVQVDFSSKPDFPAELDRIYKITDAVIRSIIVAKE
ncbi:MAG: 30S ribosomal protein S6 [Oscillospiraceae bacterium]|nr:30S ribosomal protein S6 [Oscillospiraceae bacterium]MBQ3880145.1 30S ribosomal protein S6 [Oscillospiraceae bacterium]